MSNTPLLKTEGLGIQFGGLKAVDEFNFEIDHGQLFGLIGPNGAGKTTIFNLLTGVYTPTSGIPNQNHRIRHCPYFPEYPFIQRNERY